MINHYLLIIPYSLASFHNWMNGWMKPQGQTVGNYTTSMKLTKKHRYLSLWYNPTYDMR